jgi:hypothetical protein
MSVAPAWCELSNFDPAVRHEVLMAADLRCADCAAEDGHSILVRLSTWWDAKAWVPLSGETAGRVWDAKLVIVRVVVWAPMWPWNGDRTALRALCMGCTFRRAVRDISPTPKPPCRSRRPQQIALWQG